MVITQHPLDYGFRLLFHHSLRQQCCDHSTSTRLRSRQLLEIPRQARDDSKRSLFERHEVNQTAPIATSWRSGSIIRACETQPHDGKRKFQNLNLIHYLYMMI